MFRFLSGLIDQCLRISFQPSCPLCELPAEANGLCAYCVVTHPILGPRCPRCGDVVAQEISLCGVCENENDRSLTKVDSALWLSDQAKGILHLAKFRYRFEWMSLFKEYVLTASAHLFCRDLVLIPIPLHPSKFLTRGFNQAEMLCHWLKRGQPDFMISDGLLKQTETLAQSTLNRQERRRNLKASFIWNRGVPVPKQVLLVDDVYTTGETLRACARLLKKEGVQTVYGWTLFRTPLRRQ